MKRKIMNTVKAYAYGLVFASFPFLLIAHYIIVGY